MSTIVVLRILGPAAGPRFSIFQPGYNLTQRGRRIGLRITFTGNEWVRHAASVSHILTDTLAGFKGMSPQRRFHVTNGICRSVLQGRSDQVCQVVSKPPIRNFRKLTGASIVITCAVVSPFTPVHNVTGESRPPGPEHQATATNPAQPSYCTLPTFHPPASTDQATGLGYVSNDGHVFGCRNPVVLRQAFHVYVSECLHLDSRCL